MITIFVKTGCGFCAKALRALDALGLSYEEKNISDDVVATELTEKGGKVQVPFLIDNEVLMYESDAIVEYLEKTYGGEGDASPKPRVHIAESSSGVCPS